MLKLCVTFAAFFTSLGRILWVSDDHSPKTWAFYACHNPRTLPQTPVPLTLDYRASPRAGGETPLCAFLQVLEKGEPKEQEQQGGARRADRAVSANRGAAEQETYSASCKTFVSAHLWKSKPKSQPSGCYPTVSMSNKATKHFHLLSLCLPIFMFCCRPMDMSWGDNSHAGIRNALSQAKSVISL